jgi:DNA-binding transcriptional LysR family regulator
LEHGTFTAAADELGLAQPSVAEQVRLLEQSLGARLFERLGRGLLATEAAHALRPHAERALNAADEAARAVASVRDAVTGTVRFGLFGTARLYLGSDVVADVLAAHPRLRIELVGRNSRQVLEELRRGRVEAAIIALPIDDDGLQVHPFMRDEVVYVSAAAERVRRPITPVDLAGAALVLSEASWGNDDSTRRQLARTLQSVGASLLPRIDVEDIETALEIAGLGLGDTVTARGLLARMGDRLPPGLRWIGFRPRLYDEFAVVSRRGSELSRASQVVVEFAVARMLECQRQAAQSDPHSTEVGTDV